MARLAGWFCLTRDQWKDPSVRGGWYWYLAAYDALAIAIAIGWFITISGAYGTVLSIHAAFKDGTTTSPWFCTSNVGSLE